MSATTLAVEVKPIKQPKALPTLNSDFYHFAEAVRADELALVKKVRTYMKTKIAAIIKYWAEYSSPYELLPLLDFNDNLFLFPTTAAAVWTLFRKSRRSPERSGQQ